MGRIKFAGILGLCLIAPAASATTTWSVGQFLDGATATTLQAKNAQGWSTTGGTGTATGSLQLACLHDYGTGGYGIVNTAEANPCTNEPGTGPHAADNVGATDMFLLEFASAVTLSQVKLGWNGTDNFSADSDISVLAYTGTSSVAPMAGLTATGLLANNWSLVGNYGAVGSLTNNTQTITTSISSSWWLVSAYNSGFGSTSSNGYSVGMASGDYLKLLSVAGDVAAPPPPPHGVPEPAPWALAAVGLLGLSLSRRRLAARAPV